jgi:hypothetical protein
MKTAGKLLFWIFGVIVVLIIAGFVVFLVAGDYFIKIGVERGASSALKVPVDLSSVSVHPFAGKMELKDLKVHNPAGYEAPLLMQLGAGRAAVKIGSLMTDTVEIDYLILDNIDLTIEQKGLSTNLNEILKSLPKNEQQAEAQAPGKKLLIKTLEINNVTVNARVLGTKGVTLKVAPIKMTDLGSDNKMSVAALTSKILVAIAEGTAKQGAGILPADITGSLKSGLSGAEGILKGAGTQAGEMGKGIIEQGEKAGKGIFGIFKKDANSNK